MHCKYLKKDESLFTNFVGQLNKQHKGNMEHIKEIDSTKILAHLEHKMKFFSELIHVSFLWQASEQFKIPS